MLPIAVRSFRLRISYSTQFILISRRHYASEPPKLRVKWFHATDIPNSKPDWYNYKKEKEPQKFIPFSDYDSNRLEREYQKDEKDQKTVEVNEDRLFEVDLKSLELSPVYWEGPIYEVRRGTWFSTSGIPLPKKVSDAIEEGYQQKKPYSFKELTIEEDVIAKVPKEIIDRFNMAQKDEKEKKKEEEKALIELEKQKDVASLGDGKMALYSDGKHAAIFPEDMNSKFQVDIIRKFTPGPALLLSVENVQRGYTKDLELTIFDNLPSAQIPALGDMFKSELSLIFSDDKNKNTFEEQDSNDQMKSELEQDYDQKNVEHATSARNVEHLVFCVHGIGQILGHKYESINFTHSINVLRNTMKEVYQNDDRYKVLAYPEEYAKKGKKDKEENGFEMNNNNKIQVLPISWRHRIDFHPTEAFKSYDENGNPRLPTLADINVDGVKRLRDIFGDVALDILLYYEPKYVEQIFKAVTSEINKVYKMYRKRNPAFSGKVHLLGHSLGLAIVFDIVLGKGKFDFEVEKLFCVGSPLGVFKLLGQKNIGLRQHAKTDEKVSVPNCANLYNIFHPCDPIGYRMEPLVHPKFARYKPEEVPFALKGINTQIRDLADFGDEIQEKLINAATWFSSKKKGTEKGDIKSVDERAAEENALGDIIMNLAKPENSEKDSKSKKVELSQQDLDLLTSLNNSGRIDYSLPMGVFDISLVSAISAHVSYFEDQDTAGFVMKEILTDRSRPVSSKTVRQKEKEQKV